jgi:hypothetical protein
MQQTILLYLDFSISATSDFYLGDSQHITTDSNSMTAVKNILVVSVQESITYKAHPVIMIT